MSAPAPSELVAPGGTFRSLGNRNFRLFLTGQLISQTGNWLTMVAQTLLVLRLTDSGLALGLVTACQFAPILVIGAWAGAVADRVRKRRMLFILQALAMVQSIAFAIVVFAGWQSVHVIYALALAQGMVTAFDNPIRRSFVVELVDSGELSNAVSLNTSVMTGARVFGPAVAGLLVTTVGFGWCFALDAVSYLAVLWGLWRMDPAELRQPPPAVRAPHQVRDGLAYTRREPTLFVPLVMTALISTFAFNFSVTMPLFVTGPMGGSEGLYTILFSVLSVGSVGGALLTARRTAVSARHLVVAGLAFGAPMALLAVSPGLWLAFPAAVLLGAGSSVFLTSSTAIVQLLADPGYRGRVMALQGMVLLGSTPVGGPLVGWVCERFGPRAGLLLGAASCFVAAAYAAVRFGGAAMSRAAEPMHTMISADRDPTVIAGAAQ